MNESYFSNLSSPEEFVLKCDIAGIDVKEGLNSLHHDVKEVKSSIGKVKYTGIGGKLAFFDESGLIEDVSDLVIEGDFDCSRMGLMSFEGFPKEVKGKLKCFCNNFVSLDGMPICSQLDAGAFCICEKLNTASIPSSVTSIGESVFQNCSRLTSITIPSSVTSISGSAFYGCSKLTSVMIPSSVTSIGNSTFEHCSRLTSVMIPSSVTSIGKWAFYNCSGLESVTIPSSVTNIGYDAFCICSKLSLKFENPDFKNMENYPWGLDKKQISAI